MVRLFLKQKMSISGQIPGRKWQARNSLGLNWQRMKTMMVCWWNNFLIITSSHQSWGKVMASQMHSDVFRYNRFPKPLPCTVHSTKQCVCVCVHVHAVIDQSNYTAQFGPRHKLLNGDFRCQNLNKSWRGNPKNLVECSAPKAFVTFEFKKYRGTPLHQNPIIFSPPPKEDLSRCHMGSRMPPSPALQGSLSNSSSLVPLARKGISLDYNQEGPRRPTMNLHLLVTFQEMFPYLEITHPQNGEMYCLCSYEVYSVRL